MSYDVIVIGGGPGGYIAAERSGHAGLKTLLIERKALGGTCLNEGCIPTKTLLNSAKLFNHCNEYSVPFGITADNPQINHAQVISRKNQVVQMLVSGVNMQMKRNHVEVKKGTALINGKVDGLFAVSVDDSVYYASNLIIATGSESLIPPISGLSEALASGFAGTSREFLSDSDLPESVVIVGGGVIGLEMAYYYNAVGVKVTVVEMLDKIGGPLGKDIAQRLRTAYEQEGIEFVLNAKVTEIRSRSIVYEKDNESQEIQCSKVLLCIGRVPNTSDLGLESIGVKLGTRKEIPTDNQLKTNVENCYAVGDVNGKIMLAHTAYREAECAVNTIRKINDSIDYAYIPSVIYSHPEVAFAGYTPESAKTAGYNNVSQVMLPLQYSGRYVAENNNGTGICKLIFDNDSKTLIGAHMMCDYASEIIVICSMLMTLHVTVPEMKKLVFPHPTVGEIIREAIWASGIE